MATWGQFQAEAPELAERVAAAFAVGKHCTMATLRADGSPRISGTEVEFGDGDVHVGVMPASVKGRDLLRDPRVAVHSPTGDPGGEGGWLGEAKFSGRAERVIPPRGYPDALRFRIDVTDVVFTGLNAAGNQLEITWWRPGEPVHRAAR